MKTPTRKILDKLCDNLLLRYTEVLPPRCSECGKDIWRGALDQLKGDDLKKELILDDAEKELKEEFDVPVWINSGHLSTTGGAATSNELPATTVNNAIHVEFK